MRASIRQGALAAPKLFRLLLVEDNPDDAGFVERVLTEGRGADFSVHWVSTLSSAKEVVDLETFDIIVLDLDLPDSRGVDTLTEFRSAVGHGVPIVVLSEDDKAPAVDPALFGGETECLAKLQLNHRLVPRLLYRLLQRQRVQSSLHRLIATNPDGMVVVNFDGVVLFANPAASDLFGRPIGELLHQQFGVPVVGSGAVEINVNGHRVAEMRVVEIDWQEQAAWLTSLREITARKKMEDDLREAKIEADLASRAKSQFLACMSHELRTPLNAVIGFAEMIEQGITPDEHDTCKEYAEIIHASGMHLLSVVNDILDIASVEAGRVSLDCHLFDMNQAISSSLQMLAKQAREKSIHLVYEGAPFMIPVHADYRRMRQIIINLMGNGIKYTRPGGTVTISCDCTDKGELVLTIADTGIGIAPEYLSRLMTPFGRAGDPYTNRQQGTGLGLYITRLLVELHGGRLSIDSVPDQGTVVTARFPPERVVPYRA